MMIKVYTADVGALSDPARFRRVYEGVSPWRREKADRMRLEKDRRLSLGAGALLEAALAAEGVNDFTMTTGPNEKPRLAHGAGLHFNLSHSGTKVLCAVSDHEVGCDVEQIAQADMRIARRCFCPEECAALLRCPDEARRSVLFCRYWTLKESFMKATGLGFRLALDQFCVTIGDGRITVRQSVDDRTYHFREFDRSDGYRYALCSVDAPAEGLALREVVLSDGLTMDQRP